MKTFKFSAQTGQALTEFVIGAAFVMVPLFLMISIAGKNVDIKYAAVQSARYEAWEYTANYYEEDQIEKGFTAISKRDLPVKSATEVRKEARRRFFSDTGIALSTPNDKKGYVEADANPLWRYHDATRMISPAITATAAGASLDPDEASLTAPVSAVIGFLDSALEVVESVLSAIGIDAGFTAIDAYGLAESEFAVRVANTPAYGVPNSAVREQLMPTVNNLTMNAKASVLTTNWSAGGADHTTYQTRGLVPTVLIDELLNPGGIPLQDIFSIIPFLGEFSGNNLEFGKLLADEDLHPSKIEENTGSHTCDKAGTCGF